MLSKSEIIEGMANEEIIVSNAVYEYVCNLHLYDDEQINDALINFVQNNYHRINFVGLVYSKLNKKIIECLIDISLKENDEFIKNKISSVLVNHYNIIKDMDYNFEEIIEDEENLLIYKKIKHFSKKEPSQLIELYKNNINEYYFSNNDTYAAEILRRAIGTALIQTKEGYRKLLEYMDELLEPSDEDIDEDDFTFEHMPYLVYPLCQYSNPSYYPLILALYFSNMDFIGYAEECNYYFSNICNDEFINSYIFVLKSLSENDMEDYYYSISEYLNSDTIDEFLFEELERNTSIEVKENIIRILARKFNKKIIPQALEFIKNGEFVEEEILKVSVVPLLILENCNDELSKSIIEEVRNYDLFNDDLFNDDLLSEDLNETMLDFLTNMQDFLLKNKPHIKEYKKIRKLHREIIDSMMNYFYNKNSELVIDYNINNENVYDINSKFDTSTQLGAQALGNVVIYKNAPNMNCVTEDYIKNKKYRAQEKIEFLESMLNSEAGLFEVTKTDRKEGQVYVRNVLNNNEYCLTDIGLSSNLSNENFYMYMRVITYHGISFGTGLNLVFDKKDKFIQKWIKENLADFDKKQEIVRFIELYNEYEKNGNRINVRAKSPF